MGCVITVLRKNRQYDVFVDGTFIRNIPSREGARAFVSGMLALLDHNRIKSSLVGDVEGWVVR